uniref:Ectonucleotide pyrophosphatase/phosphodiesterase family member 5 n=1 Tax=Lygus hesperus TaxID=30085 RepID=A0A0A9WUA7_LYGHE
MELIKFCFWITSISHLGNCLTPTENKLLVVSFDGFRNDYFNRSLTPNLGKLIETSVYTSRLLNVFPTKTFPNHFSIATGLYVEDHGAIGTEVMDVETGSILNYGYELFHYDENVTPIWTLNEMSNESRHSGCMMWPGCSMDYRGTKNTYDVKYNESMTWNQRVNTSISWFKQPLNPANLVMLYFESPDLEEHIYGPNSAQTNAQIKHVDDTVAAILEALEANNLTDVNVVFLSDHGMEAVTLPRIINLTAIIDGLGLAVGTSPILQIYPKKGKLEELYSKLHQYSKKTEILMFTRSRTYRSGTITRNANGLLPS